MRLAQQVQRLDWGRLAAFDRLDSASRTPVCVAVSGGGDSLAALIHTCAWAARAGRPVLALSVDHGLQPESAAWTARAGEMAGRLGARFRGLAWTGPKPAAGLPAAARQARHALLARAARDAGARVIVLGHTADDRGENAIMGLGPLGEWSASPVWPEGRGLFLLRPLIDTARAAIRANLLAGGWDWIEDPANCDLKHPRSRVRAEGIVPLLSLSGPVRPAPQGSPIGDPTVLRLPREGLTARAIALAAVCAGGGDRLPRAAEVGRIVSRIRTGETLVATLCGARIEAGAAVAFTREPGRGGLPTLALEPARPQVWDGRYEVETRVDGLTIGPLAARAATLTPAEKAKLRRIDAKARPGLPLVQRSDGTVFCPILAADSGVRVRWLVSERFLSAYGTIESERQACDVLCVANEAPASYLGALG